MSLIKFFFEKNSELKNSYYCRLKNCNFMKKNLVFLMLIAVFLFTASSCKKKCECNIRGEVLSIKESDLDKFVNQYVELSKYGIKLEKCSDLSDLYSKLDSVGIEYQKHIDCK